MLKRKIKVLTRATASAYLVEIENGGLVLCGVKIRKAVGDNAKKAIIVSNKKVVGLYGANVLKSLSASGFEVHQILIGDGERYKNLKTLESLVAAFSSNGISRTDVVVALGGGVVGDIAGFAAAIHSRGVPYIQIPTTLLSMIDSSVGGKTGINTIYGKNLVGAFYHPKLVLIDPSVLSTLPKREFTAGLCEAVKQGAISNRALFDKTVRIVDSHALTSDAFGDFLAAQIEFKTSIVQGDEREAASNTGPRSRKILNFGHTFAHALESATDYKFLKHGEAVGHGIIFAAELSKKLGILDESVVKLLRGVVHRTGTLPSTDSLDRNRVFECLKHDKKVIDGTLQWILLKGIGKPVVIPHNKIGDALVKKTIQHLISE